jgi:hypothetical protein
MTTSYSFKGMGTDTISGRVTKVLNTLPISVTASGTTPFKFGTGNYSVTSGKTFYPTTVYTVSVSTPNFAWTALVYADNGGITSGVVELTYYPMVPRYTATCGWNGPYEIFGVSVPSTKYVGVKNVDATDYGGNAASILIGYEE